MALSGAAEKLERAIADNHRLQKTIADLGMGIAKFETRLALIEAQPVPARAALRSPSKESDGREVQSVDSVDAAIKRLAGLPDDQRALALTKVSLANPMARSF